MHKKIVPSSHPAVIPSSPEAYQALEHFRKNVAAAAAPAPVQKQKKAPPKIVPNEDTVTEPPTPEHHNDRTRLLTQASFFKARALQTTDPERRSELLKGATMFMVCAHAPLLSDEGKVRIPQSLT